MKKLDNKVSVRITEQFPEFVRADNAGIITFLEKYYQLTLNPKHLEMIFQLLAY